MTAEPPTSPSAPGAAQGAAEGAAEGAAQGAAQGATEEEEPQTTHGLGHHVLDGLRRGATGGVAAGARVGAELGHAAAAMGLEVVVTTLTEERALAGHVLGMHMSVHASGIHGPRETPALLYLFGDALAIRPTDDAPMSTVPLFGLHMLLPPLAVARWVYKAGRIEHANLDLVEDAQRFADTLAQWTVDDFSEADPKLEVHHTADVTGPVHVYEHLGFANVWLPAAEGRPVRLKSALPASSDTFVDLWQLFARVTWPHDLRTDAPAEAPQS